MTPVFGSQMHPLCLLVYHFIWTDHGRCMIWTILIYLLPVRGSLEVIRWSLMPYDNTDSLQSISVSVAKPTSLYDSSVFCLHTRIRRSLRGAVVMSLALYTRGRRFDPGLLQSVGWDYKPSSRLHMTLAVGGTLNPNQPTNQLE